MKKVATGKFIPGPYTFVVRRSSTGLGLFTEDPIKKGKCVIEYKGKMLSDTQVEKILSNKYLFEVGKNKTIDGAPRTNLARYINHSCRPNCEIEIRKDRVYIMAKKNIRSGEELSYDYDTDYFDEYIKPKGCRCAACVNKKKSSPLKS